VIATLSDLLDRAAFAMRFLALFTVATGVLVVFGTIWTGRHSGGKKARCCGRSGRRRGRCGESGGWNMC